MRNLLAEDKKLIYAAMPRGGGRFSRWPLVFVWAAFFAFIIAISTPAFANISIRKAAGGKPVAAPSFVSGKVAWVSVTDFADQAGFRHDTSLSNKKWTFTNSLGAISLFLDSQFYTVDTTILILPHPPVLRESRLYLPASDIVNVFGGKYSEVISWDAKASAIIIGAPEPPPAEPKRVPASEQIAVDASFIRTIVLDPGHGGRDPGAIGPTGIYEKTVTLAIALELKNLLEKAGLTVYMTRDKDVFVPLRDRTKFANDKKADLFVSIHANSIEGDQKKRDAVKGYKIYFLSQAKNEEDRLSAMRENAVIELEDKENRQNYDALQDVLISIAGTEHLRESQELSIIMEQTFRATQKKIPRLQLGVGQANFWVLNGAYMPAVLVEAGFISNTAEETLLTDKKMQGQLAAALSESVIKFKKLFEGL